MPPFLAMTSLHVFSSPLDRHPRLTNDLEGTPGPKVLSYWALYHVTESRGKRVGAWVDFVVEASGSNYRPGAVIYCILLYHIILYYIAVVFYYVTLHYITLHCSTLHCSTLPYITLHHMTLHYVTLHSITLHYVKPYCMIFLG